MDSPTVYVVELASVADVIDTPEGPVGLFDVEPRVVGHIPTTPTMCSLLYPAEPPPLAKVAADCLHCGTRSTTDWRKQAVKAGCK